METKFLLRNSTGDQPIAADAELREALQKGQAKPSDFLFDFQAQKWGRVGDHPVAATLFSGKPAGIPDRRVIYFLVPGATGPQGPFSTKEIQARAQARELCASTWVFVEGDKEWRQVRNVKILHDMLPALPADAPAHPAPPLAAVPEPVADKPPASPPPAFRVELGSELPPPNPDFESTNPSIKLDLGMGEAADAGLAPAPLRPSGGDLDDSHIEREEITMALDTKGLNLHSAHAKLPPAPPPAAKAAKPPPPAPGAPARPATPPGIVASPTAAHAEQAADSGLSLFSNPAIQKPKGPPREAGDFDGIVAEIPLDPIWLVKQANSETVSGPFRFLEVVEMLEQGRLTKNDKIARASTKAFAKIAQQYEFNVKYTIETMIENGLEKQKILIKRRHPRVPYMTGVQVVSRHGLLAGQCVNISAGGILMEIPKAEFNLGEIIEIKILPALISKPIACKALIIGKIPKIPPGYALKFEDLRPEDKEVIEHFVQETLKREMSKKN